MKKKLNRKTVMTLLLSGVMVLGSVAAGVGGVGVAHASSSGDGLYSALSNIYGAAQSSVSNAIAGSTSTSQYSSNLGQIGSYSSGLYSSGGSSYSTSSSSGTSKGGTTTVNGRRVITYYPVYNTEQQQRMNIQQQVQQRVKQELDISGNSYYSYANGGSDISGNAITGSGLSGTIDQWTSALTPDIAALESDPVGPIVNTVSLSESYHDNYKIYEERFSDLYAIYTNIANGSISNRPAIFDVPGGVSVRMTRDGRSVGFTNKAQIKEEGTYVVQFYVPQDGSETLPAWQQTIERGRFVFRIQYTAGLDGTPLEVEEPSELQSFADLVQGEGEVLLPGDSATSEIEQNTQTDATAQEEPLKEASDANTVMSAAGGLSTTYDTSSGYYNISLLTGDSFSSSIPNGMVTNNAVLFLPGENMRFELYRDGEAVEYEGGEYISGGGDYILIPVKDDLEYESYYRANKPMFRFRILTGAVSDLGVFSAPEINEITAVRHGEEDVTDKALITDRTASLSGDGRWEIDLAGEAGLTTVTVSRDTVPPQVRVTSEPNTARIEYISDDIAGAVLMRGNQEISRDQLPTVVTDVGRYQLTVYDIAGNETEKEFNVTYRVNVFAVLAIVMVIALGAALVIFMRRVKTNVRVR